MKRLQQCILVGSLPPAGRKLRVLVELESLDDLHRQRVGLQDSDLCINRRSIFRIVQQRRISASETQHATVVVAVKHYHHSSDRLVLWFHEQRGSYDNPDDNECESGNCPLAVPDDTPHCCCEHFIRRAYTRQVVVCRIWPRT